MKGGVEGGRRAGKAVGGEDAELDAGGGGRGEGVEGEGGGRRCKVERGEVDEVEFERLGEHLDRRVELLLHLAGERRDGVVGRDAEGEGGWSTRLNDVARRD